MPEGEQETAEPQPVKISPEILTSLGLNQEDVDELNKARIEEQKVLNGLRITGTNTFTDYRVGPNPPSIRIQINEKGYVSATAPKPDQLPDQLIDNWNKLKTDTQLPEIYEPIGEKRLKAFLLGFGNQALNDSDWRSALSALDLSTDGGIMQNRYALDKFREIAGGNKAVGVEIAQAIQERINRRNGGSAEQTPDPQRIPPEQRTPPEYAADTPERVVVGGQEEHPADLRPAPPQSGEPQV